MSNTSNSFYQTLFESRVKANQELYVSTGDAAEKIEGVKDIQNGAKRLMPSLFASLLNNARSGQQRSRAHKFPPAFRLDDYDESKAVVDAIGTFWCKRFPEFTYDPKTSLVHGSQSMAPPTVIGILRDKIMLKAIKSRNFFKARVDLKAVLEDLGYSTVPRKLQDQKLVVDERAIQWRRTVGKLIETAVSILDTMNPDSEQKGAPKFVVELPLTPPPPTPTVLVLADALTAAKPTLVPPPTDRSYREAYVAFDNSIAALKNVASLTFSASLHTRSRDEIAEWYRSLYIQNRGARAGLFDTVNRHFGGFSPDELFVIHKLQEDPHLYINKNLVFSVQTQVELAQVKKAAKALIDWFPAFKFWSLMPPQPDAEEGKYHLTITNRFGVTSPLDVARLCERIIFDALWSSLPMSTDTNYLRRPFITGGYLLPEQVEEVVTKLKSVWAESGYSARQQVNVEFQPVLEVWSKSVREYIDHSVRNILAFAPSTSIAQQDANDESIRRAENELSLMEQDAATLSTAKPEPKLGEHVQAYVERRQALLARDKEFAETIDKQLSLGNSNHRDIVAKLLQDVRHQSPRFSGDILVRLNCTHAAVIAERIQTHLGLAYTVVHDKQFDGIRVLMRKLCESQTAWILGPQFLEEHVDRLVNAVVNFSLRPEAALEDLQPKLMVVTSETFPRSVDGIILQTNASIEVRRHWSMITRGMRVVIDTANVRVMEYAVSKGLLAAPTTPGPVSQPSTLVLAATTTATPVDETKINNLLLESFAKRHQLRLDADAKFLKNLPPMPEGRVRELARLLKSIRSKEGKHGQFLTTYEIDSNIVALIAPHLTKHFAPARKVVYGGGAVHHIEACRVEGSETSLALEFVEEHVDQLVMNVAIGVITPMYALSLLDNVMTIAGYGQGEVERMQKNPNERVRMAWAVAADQIRNVLHFARIALEHELAFTKGDAATTTTTAVATPAPAEEEKKPEQCPLQAYVARYEALLAADEQFIWTLDGDHAVVVAVRKILHDLRNRLCDGGAFVPAFVLGFTMSPGLTTRMVKYLEGTYSIIHEAGLLYGDGGQHRIVPQHLYHGTPALSCGFVQQHLDYFMTQVARGNKPIQAASTGLSGLLELMGYKGDPANPPVEPYYTGKWRENRQFLKGLINTAKEDLKQFLLTKMDDIPELVPNITDAEAAAQQQQQEQEPEDQPGPVESFPAAAGDGNAPAAPADDNQARGVAEPEPAQAENPVQVPVVVAAATDGIIILGSVDPAEAEPEAEQVDKDKNKDALAAPARAPHSPKYLTSALVNATLWCNRRAAIADIVDQYARAALAESKSAAYIPLTKLAGAGARLGKEQRSILQCIVDRTGFSVYPQFVEHGGETCVELFLNPGGNALAMLLSEEDLSVAAAAAPADA